MNIYQSVLCEHPVVLVNPSLRRLINFCTHLLFDGSSHFISPHERYSILSGESFFKVFHQPFIDFNKLSYHDRINFLSNYFILDADSASCYPLFVEVRCNHCSLCRQSKVSSYMQRAQFMSEESSTQPLFVTLTYNNSHLPDDGVLKSHVQAFKKRFKKSLSNFCFSHNIPFFSEHLKFIVSSEYTPSTKRPHYHIFITGVPTLFSNPVSFHYEICHLVQYSWREPERCGKHYLDYPLYCKRFPIIFSRPKDYDSLSFGYSNVTLCRSFDSVKYILKYSLKSSGDSDNVPLGKNDNFVLCSKNMGLQWIQKFRPEILSSLDGSFNYSSVIDGEVHNCQICSYYIKKLFPGFSSLVPSELRKAADNLVLSVRELCLSKTVDSSVKCAALSSLFYCTSSKPYLFSDLPLEPSVPNSLRYADFSVISSLSNIIMDSFNTIVSIDIDIDEINKKLAERDYFLGLKNFIDSVPLSSFKSKNDLSEIRSKVKLF